MSANILRKYISGPLALDLNTVRTGAAISGPGPVLTSATLQTGGTGPTGPTGPTVAGPAGPTGATGAAGPTIISATFTNSSFQTVETYAIASAATYHIVAAQPVSAGGNDPMWMGWGRVSSTGVVQVYIATDATGDALQWNLRLIDTRLLDTVAVSGPQ